MVNGAVAGALEHSALFTCWSRQPSSHSYRPWSILYTYCEQYRNIYRSISKIHVKKTRILTHKNNGKILIDRDPLWGSIEQTSVLEDFKTDVALMDFSSMDFPHITSTVFLLPFISIPFAFLFTPFKAGGQGKEEEKGEKRKEKDIKNKKDINKKK